MELAFQGVGYSIPNVNLAMMGVALVLASDPSLQQAAATVNGAVAALVVKLATMDVEPATQVLELANQEAKPANLGAKKTVVDVESAVLDLVDVCSDAQHHAGLHQDFVVGLVLPPSPDVLVVLGQKSATLEMEPPLLDTCASVPYV